MADKQQENQKVDRRRFLRVPFETEIVARNLETGQEVRSLRSRDISLKGIYCFTKTPFPSGTPCAIDLRLTGTSSMLWLHIDGQVARADNEGMALSFDSMDLDVFIHLKNILYYNSGDPDRIDREIKKL